MTWRRTLGDWWYRAKCFLWYRYSIVRPRWLGHTWVDRDELLAHAMFEVLGRFLEEECGPDVAVDWDARDDSRAALAEMRELWRWWTEDYLTADDRLHDQYMKGVETPDLVRIPMAKGTMFRLEQAFSSPAARDRWAQATTLLNLAERALGDELKARMKRLVDVKDFMWT